MRWPEAFGLGWVCGIVFIVLFFQVTGQIHLW